MMATLVMAAPVTVSSLTTPMTTPAVVPLEGTPSNNFSVGVLSFVAFVFLVVALWLLMRNMNARIRRMSYSDRDRREETRRSASRGADGDEGARAGDSPGSPKPADDPRPNDPA